MVYVLTWGRTDQNCARIREDDQQLELISMGISDTLKSYE